MTSTGPDLVRDGNPLFEIVSYSLQKCTNVRLLRPLLLWRHPPSLLSALLDTSKLPVASAPSPPSGLLTFLKSSSEGFTRIGTDRRRRPSPAMPRSTLRTAASQLPVSWSASANTALSSVFLPTLKSAKLAWARRRLISWRFK